MNRVIAVIWSGMLAATVVGVVPTVVALLQRALTAARNIERYTDEILASGVGIAANTADVAALKTTLTVAPELLAGAQGLQQHAAAIEAALSSSADDAEVRA